MVKFDYSLDLIIKKTKYWCTKIFETNEIRPTHILYSIIKDETNIIYNILWEMGIDIELLSEELRKNAIIKNNTLDVKNVYTSKILETILHNAIENKAGDELSLVDIMKSILSVKNECSSMLKNYGITKKEFNKTYESYISHNNDMVVMGYTFHPTNIQPEFNEEDVPHTTNILTEYCRNLSILAKKKKLSKVYGRDKEIKICLEILNKNEKKNILLLGEGGVGKTSIVEGLAYIDTDKTYLELDVNKMVAGTKFRGELEKKMDTLLKMLKNKKNIVLFIDEAHVLKSAGSSDDGLSFLNVLKPPMARGEIQLILATTKNEYTMHLEGDKAFSRRCSIVNIKEPDKETTLLILKKFSEKYNFNISNDALNEIYGFSKKYLLNKHMPDKAIDILDTGYAKAMLSDQANDINLRKNLEKELTNILTVRAELKAQGNYELFEKIDAQKNQLKAKLSLLSDSKLNVTEQIIQQVFEENYGIKKELNYDSERLALDLEWFKSKIKGQDEILEDIIKKFYISKLKHDIIRPLNFFLLGNSGVGKTNTAEIFAKKYFNGKLMVIDCSEYKESHSVSNLIGSPPGYVRSDEGGLLTNFVDKEPYSVILFDEIEEAHESILAILLQILSKGILTDKRNLKANFLNTVIFFTSNIGVKENNNKIGFNSDKLNKDLFKSSLSKTFQKKFLNRINNFYVYNNLTKEDYEKIYLTKIDEIQKEFKNRLKIKISKKTKDLIISKCIENNDGVRKMYDLIDEHIYEVILNAILSNKKTITV